MARQGGVTAVRAPRRALRVYSSHFVLCGFLFSRRLSGSLSGCLRLNLSRMDGCSISLFCSVEMTDSLSLVERWRKKCKHLDRPLVLCIFEGIEFSYCFSVQSIFLRAHSPITIQVPSKRSKFQSYRKLLASNNRCRHSPMFG